jgi:acyl phosphate:glycerol-3-phosphate acyltransferase
MPRPSVSSQPSPVQWLPHLLTLIAGYLLGSIPTGYLVARAKRVDIRSVGSGNIGATNVFRVLGKGPGVFVLLADALKGFAAVFWLPAVVLQFAAGDATWLPAIGAVAAVLGHNYTCWLGFKGGKGIATSAGALAGLVPWAFVIILVTWLVVFAASRYVSLASICAAAVLPFGTAFTMSGPLRWPLVGLTGLLSALAIWRHKPNIQRLFAGTENRIGKRKDAPQ